jgi:hypothetical protein
VSTARVSAATAADAAESDTPDEAPETAVVPRILSRRRAAPPPPPEDEPLVIYELETDAEANWADSAWTDDDDGGDAGWAPPAWVSAAAEAEEPDDEPAPAPPPKSGGIRAAVKAARSTRTSN